MPSYRLLGADRLSPEERAFYPYLTGWQERFDYVLLLDAGGAPDLATLLPERLTPVNRSDMAALFRVRRNAIRQAQMPRPR